MRLINEEKSLSTHWFIQANTTMTKCQMFFSMNYKYLSLSIILMWVLVHASQTAKIMLEFEKVCIESNPDFVILVGDVNSTLACAITAKK